MRKNWDLIARYVRRDDPEAVYFVKMRGITEYVCSCGGASNGKEWANPCRHIQHAIDEVVDERGTIALAANAPQPPKKYGDRTRQIRWWVERNVQQYFED